MKSNDLIILIVITTMLFFAHFTKKWSLVSAIMFIMFIMFFFFTQYEIAGLVCFVAFLVLGILDAKHKGNESVFIKYNIYSEHCVLPKKFVLIISIIGVICSILSIIGMLIGC